MFVYTGKKGDGVVLMEEGRAPITIRTMPKNPQATISIGIDASKNVDIIPIKKISRPRLKHQSQANTHKGHHEDVQKT